MWRVKHAFKHIKPHLLDWSLPRSRSTKVKIFNSYYGKKQEYQVGSEVEGFIVTEIADVPEFHLSAAMLKHEATQAEYLHLFRNDNNNCFSIGFRTTPTDSTGLTHILEHTTLCGSQRYPCRDPFFKMMNRSLATFMNALTGPDYTMYPFATQNPHDFNNLLSVYLDAVFKPRLRELDFKQEGWRLEHENINDPKSNIVFKGVVFNEMKGSFSDPQSVFGQALLNNLLPSHTYGHISGGDPCKIPLLSHEDLKAYHRKYYNANNAKFYSYGNFPLANHLAFINKNYLRVSDNNPMSFPICTAVPLEVRWTSPRRKHISCRIDPLVANPNKQSTIAISVLLHDICDLRSGFVWNVLSQLLINGPNSSFYKTLVEPQIGAGFTPCTGYEYQTRDTFFSVGLQGVDPKDFDKVVETFDKTIEDVIAVGFDPKHVEAVLHGIELSIKNEMANFGLSILFSIAPVWNHQGNIIELLRVNDQLQHFREMIKMNPRYLQEVLENRVKGSQHKLVLTMSPDEAYEKNIAKEEKLLLEKKVNSLSESDKVNIMLQSRELLKEQCEANNSSCLPTLRVHDLNADLASTELESTIVDGVPVQIAQQPTNGLVYFRGILNVSSLTKQQKRLLPLFATAVTKMGTERNTFRELDQKINLKTGGMCFTPHIKNNLFDLRTHEEGILFSSFCLQHNLEDMFDILLDILCRVRLDDLQRFETITRMSATNLANSLIDRGHQYAMLSAGSFVNNSVAFKESISGVTYVDEIRRIAQLKDMTPIMNELRAIANDIFNKSHIRTAVNFSETTTANILESLEYFFGEIPGKIKDPNVFSPVDDFRYDHNAVHHVLPIPVNFTAKAVQTVPYTHKDYALLTVLTKLISAKYLHPLIREKGGAYGSGALLSMSGTLLFYSYRDPNSSVTFRIFDDAGRWVSQKTYTQQDLEEAILSVFQKVDAPVPPGQKGMDCFLFGVCDSTLQEHRERLMSVTRQDLVDVAEKYLGEKPSRVTGRALLGPVNAIIHKDRKNESWLVKIHE